MKRKEYLYCQQIRWWMKKSVREYWNLYHLDLGWNSAVSFRDHWSKGSMYHDHIWELPTSPISYTFNYNHSSGQQKPVILLDLKQRIEDEYERGSWAKQSGLVKKISLSSPEIREIEKHTSFVFGIAYTSTCGIGWHI
jgi:hypothetical protein